MKLELNKAFKAIMAAKGVSAISIAKKLGVNSSTISRSIGKGSNPTQETLEKYASCIGVNVSEVFLMAEKIKKDNEK